MVANYDSKEGLNDVTLSHVKKTVRFFAYECASTKPLIRRLCNFDRNLVGIH